MNKLSKLLLTAGLLAMAGIANATPINGAIGFASAFGASWSITTDTSGNDWLNFSQGVDGSSPAVPADAVVNAKIGDYDTIAYGTAADFKDFIFNPFASNTLLWDFSVGTNNYSFIMNSQNVSIAGNTTTVKGGGMMTASSFDNTFGTYSITLNGDGGAFNWSSTAAPEPAITLLLATGLLGFGFARKMRKSA